MGRGVLFFNETRLAVLHPGFISVHKFCTDCAHPLDEDAARSELIEALTNPPVDGRFTTRESYSAWVLSA